MKSVHHFEPKLRHASCGQGRKTNAVYAAGIDGVTCGGCLLALKRAKARTVRAAELKPTSPAPHRNLTASEKMALQVKSLQAENAQLKRDAACFAALYEIAKISLFGDWCWVIAFKCDQTATKDIERFRTAIEAQIPA